MTKSKQQIIDDGRYAERLLDDVDFNRMLDEIKGDCHLQFELTDIGDKDGREAVYMKLRGVEAVRQALRAMIDNASIEIKSK
tara:strand:+ start:248 stop:493 length:246 start_codon:yes stop_codon:yes gene_type:complete